MKYLWTPWRSTYMKEKKDKTKCIFCEAAASTEDAKSLVVHRGQFCFVILNRYPYTSGHLMIAPYRHVSRLTAVDEVTTAEMMQLVRRAETVLQEAYSPDGLNLGMNLGEAAGAGIEQHIHMHVLPRWRGDANFMTSVGATRIIPEALEDTYRKVREMWGSLVGSGEEMLR
ncbi:MAG: HIT domain-containing protein [Acidobacteriaceae bacterium]|nr:HIT domain-containing protein [Acidobacteriaceae bacterium]MBV9677849.1 HIT domain-containing protein [Acidobacteriaceae bacterium]MBV9937078.1 HIT domain-containing protein [Acidobacteriaceae bacterium]